MRIGVAIVMLGLSVIVAGIVSSLAGSSFWIMLTIAVAVSTGPALLFLRWMSSHLERRDEELSRFDRVENEVFSIAREEAERRAREILLKGRAFRTRRALSVLSDSETLGDVGRLLEEFEEVRVEGGEAVLARALLGPSRYDKDGIRIGQDSDGREIVVRSGGNAVYEFAAPGEAEASYPSIFHWVLLQATILRTGASDESSGE